MASSLSEALPYISQAATLAIAAAAVISPHRTSKEDGERELSAKTWEKRTDTYTEILRTLRDLDPTKRPSPEGILESHSLGEDETNGTDIFARDFDSDEWKDFSARVDSFASDEVRYLFYLWFATIAGWSWLMMKCLIHQNGDTIKYADANRELQRCYSAAHEVSKELTEQVRAELAFKKRSVRRVTATGPEGFFGALTEVSFSRGKQLSLEPPSVAHVISVRRTNHRDGRGE